MIAYFQREPITGRITCSDKPDSAFPLCLDYDASDETLHAAFCAWSPFAPAELRWQVDDLVQAGVTGSRETKDTKGPR